MMLKPFFCLILSILSLAYDARPLFKPRYDVDSKPEARLRRLMPAPAHVTPHSTGHSAGHKHSQSASHGHTPNTPNRPTVSKANSARSRHSPSNQEHPLQEGKVGVVKQMVQTLEHKGKPKDPPPLKAVPRKTKVKSEVVEETIQVERNGAARPRDKVDWKIEVAEFGRSPQMEKTKQLKSKTTEELDISIPKAEVGKVPQEMVDSFYEFTPSLIPYSDRARSAFNFSKYVEFNEHGVPEIPKKYTDLLLFDYHAHRKIRGVMLPRESVQEMKTYVNLSSDEITAKVESLLNEWKRSMQLNRLESVELMYHPNVDRFIDKYVENEFKEDALAQNKTLKDEGAFEVNEMLTKKAKKTKKTEKGNSMMEIPHVFEYWRIMDPDEHAQFARELHDPSYPGYQERRKKSLKSLKKSNEKLKKEQTRRFEDAIKALPNSKEVMREAKISIYEEFMDKVAASRRHPEI